ncbi:coiled-coil domain-containing protein [Legionella sp. WA2024007413]
MPHSVTLNQNIQDLIHKLGLIDPSLVKLFEHQTTTDIDTIITWYQTCPKIKSNEEAFFLVTSLRANLLRELNKSLNSGKREEDTTKTPMSAKAKYALLALAGITFFGCEGFDGITAFMGIFSSIPSLAIFATGLAFSIISMIVFCSFDLVEISKNLGVKSSETPQLIDAALDEFKQIKAMRARLIRLAKEETVTRDELDKYLKLAKILLQRHKELDEIRMDLTLASESMYLTAAKFLTAGVAGMIFFSGGFFAGQTVSLAIASLFVTTMSATAWPIVVAAVVVGLAALAVYWFVERPGIENLISRWKGLDKEKIDELCKIDLVDKEAGKLNDLIKDLDSQIKRVDETAADKAQIEKMKKEIDRLKQENSELNSKVAGAEQTIDQLTKQLKERPVMESEPANAGSVDAPMAPSDPTDSFQIYGSSAAGHSFFGMKKSASTGNLLHLARKENTTPKWI